MKKLSFSLAGMLAKDAERIAADALPKAAEHVAGKLREAVSVEDGHSLAELRNLDHPYATRHEGQPGHAEAITGHVPIESVVHKRSGEMADSVFTSDVEKTSTGFKVKVGFDLSRSKHAEHVLFGTSKMIGRDVLSHVVNEERNAVSGIISESVKKIL